MSVINCSQKLLLYLNSFGSVLTRRGHTSLDVHTGQQRGTLNFYKGCGDVRSYLPRRLENKMCGTLLFLCFRNLILVRISAYAATQIWLGAMSFSFACSWNDGTFHRTSNTFTAKIFESIMKYQTCVWNSTVADKIQLCLIYF